MGFGANKWGISRLSPHSSSTRSPTLSQRTRKAGPAPYDGPPCARRIAAHPCKERKDGAPSVGMVHTNITKSWATRLARPIGTDQANFFAGIQLKRSIHEEQLLAILF